MAEIIGRDAADIAAIMAKETGKPVSIGVRECMGVVQRLKHGAENTDVILKERVVETDSTYAAYALNAVGVIYKIVPFNFPMILLFKSVSDAILLGNALLVRPPNTCPLLGEKFNAIFEEAGATRLKVVFSTPEDTDFVMEQKEVQGVIFTGSTTSSKMVAVSAAKQLKPALIEAGGSDPMVIMPDADVDKAVQLAVVSRLSNSGQICIASKRMIVPRAISTEFIAKLEAASKGFAPGDPLKQETVMGPLSSHRIYDGVAAQVE